MSKWEKLLRKLGTISNDLTFEELRKILYSYGYAESQPRSGSSHYTFRKGKQKNNNTSSQANWADIYRNGKKTD